MRFKPEIVLTGLQLGLTTSKDQPKEETTPKWKLNQ